jgi:hypothetical protein
MTRIALRQGLEVEIEANGHKYNYDYCLADDIYPRWQTFVKPVHQSKGKKQIQFHNAQTAARKDAVRAFEIFASLICYCDRTGLILEPRLSLVYYECLCYHAHLGVEW